jgi:hypothetical protein
LLSAIPESAFARLILVGATAIPERIAIEREKPAHSSLTEPKRSVLH